MEDESIRSSGPAQMTKSSVGSLPPHETSTLMSPSNAEKNHYSDILVDDIDPAVSQAAQERMVWDGMSELPGAIQSTEQEVVSQRSDRGGHDMPKTTSQNTQSANTQRSADIEKNMAVTLQGSVPSARDADQVATQTATFRTGQDFSPTKAVGASGDLRSTLAQGSQISQQSKVGLSSLVQEKPSQAAPNMRSAAPVKAPDKNGRVVGNKKGNASTLQKKPPVIDNASPRIPPAILMQATSQAAAVVSHMKGPIRKMGISPSDTVPGVTPSGLAKNVQRSAAAG